MSINFSNKLGCLVVDGSGRTSTTRGLGYPGSNAASVALRFFSESNVNYVKITKLPLEEKFRQYDLTTCKLIQVIAKGEDAKEGWEGERGLKGDLGRYGVDSKSSVKGTDGGRGGNGKIGGPGGKGGNGGDGGTVMIKALSNEADLLYLVSSDVSGGKKGVGGAGGRGGQGGDGGQGGKGRGYSETKPSHEIVLTTTTVFSRGGGCEISSNSSVERVNVTKWHPAHYGEHGEEGLEGPRGPGGSDGEDGRDGKVRFCLEDEGTEYPELFRPMISRMKVKDAKPFYEPDELCSIEIEVGNESSIMPMPKLDHPFTVGVQGSDWIAFDRDDALKVAGPIDVNGLCRLEKPLRFRIKPIEGGSLHTVPVTCILDSSRISSFKSPQISSLITVGFPVRMLPPGISETILPTKPVSLTIEVENLSNVSLGIDSPLKKAVKVRLSCEAQHPSVIWMQGGSWYTLDSTGIEHDVADISPSKVGRVFGQLVFPKGTPSYHPVKFKVELLTSDPNCLSKMRVIQTDFFSPIVSESPEWNPKADVILCVNPDTPDETVERWKEKLKRKLKIECFKCDISTENPFKIWENSNFKKHLKGKVVVVLNHLFTNKDGVKTRPDSLLEAIDMYKYRDMGIYILGGKNKILPILSERKGPAFDSIPKYLSQKRSIIHSSQITIGLKSFSHPRPELIYEKAEEVLEEVSNNWPTQRYHMEVFPNLRVDDIGCCQKTYTLGVCIILTDPNDIAPKVLSHYVSDERVLRSGDGEFDPAQVLKLLPFPRRIDLLQAYGPGDKIPELIPESIQASLIEDLLPYFRCPSSKVLSQEETEELLEKLSHLRNACLSKNLTERLMLSYEEFLINMKNHSSSNKRFFYIVKSAQADLKDIRRARKISEEKYHNALTNKERRWTHSKFKPLLEEIIQPTSSQKEWFEKGVYREETD